MMPEGRSWDLLEQKQPPLSTKHVSITRPEQVAHFCAKQPRNIYSFAPSSRLRNQVRDLHRIPPSPFCMVAPNACLLDQFTSHGDVHCLFPRIDWNSVLSGRLKYLKMKHGTLVLDKLQGPQACAIRFMPCTSPCATLCDKFVVRAGCIGCILALICAVGKA